MNSISSELAYTRGSILFFFFSARTPPIHSILGWFNQTNMRARNEGADFGKKTLFKFTTVVRCMHDIIGESTDKTYEKKKKKHHNRIISYRSAAERVSISITHKRIIFVGIFINIIVTTSLTSCIIQHYRRTIAVYDFFF